MEQYTVYKHTNKINGKLYFGITKQDPKKRWQYGFGYLKQKNGKYQQPAMAKAIIKYGWDNFEHEIILRNVSKEEAEYAERYLIAIYRTQDRDKGYNILSSTPDELGKYPKSDKKQDKPKKDLKDSKEPKKRGRQKMSDEERKRRMYERREKEKAERREKTKQKKILWWKNILNI